VRYVGRLSELVYRVLAESKLWGLPAPYIDELMKLAEKLRLPARRDVVKDFVAAYCVVKGLMNSTTADRVVASSSKGRRLWQRRLIEVLRTECQPASNSRLLVEA